MLVPMVSMVVKSIKSGMNNVCLRFVAIAQAHVQKLIFQLGYFFNSSMRAL